MKNIIKILSVILILSFAIILIWNIAYSKYNNSNDVVVYSSVANPKIFIQNEKEIIENLNDNTIVYEFSVRNSDEASSSEVSFNYYINFDIGSAPLIIKLYRINEDGEEEIALSENKTIEAEKFELGDVEKYYRLELEYDKNSDEILEDDFDVNIYLQAIQEEVI